MENEEIENVETDTLLNLVKQSLGIIETSTIKDNEISMLIGAAEADMIRQDIDVTNKLENDLIQATIVMFVKANFEYLDEATRKRALEMYHLSCTNLSLSQEYQVSEEE